MGPKQKTITSSTYITTKYVDFRGSVMSVLNTKHFGTPATSWNASKMFTSDFR